MATYTLTLSISSDSSSEIASTVAALEKSLSSLNGESPSTLISFPKERFTPDADPVAWYAEHAAAFLDELTPDATRAVLFVAKHAPTVTIATLSSELKLGKGPALAGKLASIGWAVRRLSAPPPFRRVRERYEIEPEVAEALLAARPAAARRASPARGTARTIGRTRGSARRTERGTQRAASQG
jgi:hypothetical protein